MPNYNLKEIYENAIKLIEKNGWTQAKDWDNNHAKSICAGFALEEAAGEKGYYNIMTIYAPILKEIGEESISAVYGWNDAPERTKEEVIATLRKVADSL